MLMMMERGRGGSEELRVCRKKSEFHWSSYTLDCVGKAIREAGF